MLQSISAAFHEGGWGMWLILITSIFIIGILVERSVYLFKASVDKDKLLAAGRAVLVWNSGMRFIACSRMGMKWSQSSGSVSNSKSSRMPPMPQGLAFGSKAPIIILPASDL